jgi:eukaryotic-like serine/threonine-protein kinase
MFDPAAKPIPGTEVEGHVVASPVFSPDNASIVFYTGSSSSGTGAYEQMKGTLKRISVSGGAAVTLCDLQLPFGVSWSGDSILFGQAFKGILRVAASGGEPEQLIGIGKDEIAAGPVLLPGGDTVLFTLVRGMSGRIGPTDDTWDKADIVVQSIGSGARKTLIHGGSDARYLPSGHLVYAVAGTLRVVAFDVQHLEVRGKPTPVLEGVGRSRFGPMTRTGLAHAALSNTGSLVYLPGPASPTSSLQNLAYIERRGAVESLKLTPARYEFPRVSPDGKQVAVGINDGADANIWIYDLSGTTAIRQLTSGGKNRFPAWSADGQYVTFESEREGDPGIFWQRADGTAPAERLTKADAGTSHVPDAWSPKNEQLLFDVHAAAGHSLAMLSLRERKWVPFDGVRSASIAPVADFSPDGRWVAYQSGEVPSTRIFMQSASASGQAFPVANGRNPRFSLDGKQVYYTVADRMFAVDVRMEPSFSVSNPVVVNQNTATGGVRTSQARRLPGGSADDIPTAVLPRSWDRTLDGRFIGIIDETPSSTSFARQIDVVLNWVDEVKRRVSSK